MTGRTSDDGKARQKGDSGSRMHKRVAIGCTTKWRVLKGEAASIEQEICGKLIVLVQVFFPLCQGEDLRTSPCSTTRQNQLQLCCNFSFSWIVWAILSTMRCHSRSKHCDDNICDGFVYRAVPHSKYLGNKTRGVGEPKFGLTDLCSLQK